MCVGRSSSETATLSRMFRGAFLWLTPVSTKFNVVPARFVWLLSINYLYVVVLLSEPRITLIVMMGCDVIHPGHPLRSRFARPRPLLSVFWAARRGRIPPSLPGHTPLAALAPLS